MRSGFIRLAVEPEVLLDSDPYAMGALEPWSAVPRHRTRWPGPEIAGPPRESHGHPEPASFPVLGPPSHPGKSPGGGSPNPIQNPGQTSIDKGEKDTPPQRADRTPAVHPPGQDLDGPLTLGIAYGRLLQGLQKALRLLISPRGHRWKDGLPPLHSRQIPPGQSLKAIGVLIDALIFGIRTTFLSG